MITSADMLAWTGLEVAQSLIDIYEPVCNKQLEADGGELLSHEMKVMALCYLIASKIEAKNTNNQFTAEHLGSYSYSRRTSNSITYWMELYNDLLNNYIGKFNTAKGNGIERVDKDVLALNWRY